MEIRTNSATVFNWIGTAITEKKEGLDKEHCRNDYPVMVSDTIRADDQTRTGAVFMSLERNKANVLTQITKNWMKGKGVTSVCYLWYKDLKKLPYLHQMQVGRTLYLVCKFDLDVTKEAV